jgi:bacterioferritin-associated ferredoxin
VQKTIQAENKIQERGWLSRLWNGGDKEAAEEIANEVKLNAGKVQQLLTLKEGCTKCSAEVKAVIEEQIQKVTTEQTRLENLSKEEKKAAGVWGWFKGLFSKNTTE